MDCIDLFKKAAAALQTDPRYLELDAARRENDSDEELQNLIGEFNLARLDLNNESAKAETNAARVAAGCRLYLQPEWSVAERVMPAMVEYAKAHPRWNISVQTHKYMHIP